MRLKTFFHRRSTSVVKLNGVYKFYIDERRSYVGRLKFVSDSRALENEYERLNRSTSK